MLDFGSVLLQYLDGTGSKYTLSTGNDKIGTYTAEDSDDNYRIMLIIMLFSVVAKTMLGIKEQWREMMNIVQVHCFGSPCRCYCLLIPSKKDQIFLGTMLIIVAFSVAAKTMLGIKEQWREMMYIVQVHSWLMMREWHLYRSSNDNDNYNNVDQSVVLCGSQDNAWDRRTIEGDDVHCTSTFMDC